jgi:23S rRNA A1618 N6-methylase RlmF
MDLSDDDYDNHDDKHNDHTMETSSKKRRHPDSNVDGDDSNQVASGDILVQAEDPNFEELACQYPAFAQAWAATKANQREKGPHATFSSCVTQEFTIALTRAILMQHFRLKLPYLDEEHLCPPIPNRFFYLHWIHTRLLPRNMNEHNQLQVQRCGLDLGSGASCIYSLLAARFFRWTMVTSEIDPQAVALARANAKANYLGHFITVLQVPPSWSQQQQRRQQQQPPFDTTTTWSTTPGGPLQRALDAWQNQLEQGQNDASYPLSSSPRTFDFVMTNPPFYDNSILDEPMESSNARAGDGRARTNMTVSEGNYPGGEVGFVLEMLEDSLLSSRSSSSSSPVWYSSMLGKKSSLLKLHKILIHVLGPAMVGLTEYGPGQYTRWFLAWTFRQPLGTALEACVPSGSDQTTIEIDDPSIRTPNAALEDVANRVVDYCASSPGGWNLAATMINRYDGPPFVTDASSPSSTIGTTPTVTVRIQESNVPPMKHFVDETEPEVHEHIPQSILQALYSRGEREENSHTSFLPEEGHFVIDVKITVPPPRRGVNSSSYKVDVIWFCFRHSTRGAKAIEKIRNGLVGEIGRTNRKWRKIRERMQWDKQMG